ncbi:MULTISPECIES: DUF411 domain-containing protein [unclassified Roseitalea]|uniref:DUF411 domain-containing protein n=1 Tax=unclassified Roseitalea TaxID=2639107 RepID=UPI00273E9996|nr:MULTISPECIES: DUF411 domain-containing protein [unclassified Roseitalea]
MNKTITALALTATLAAFGSASAQQADPDKTITVYKTPWCGCCQVWADRMIEAGFTVRTHDMEDLSLIKKQGGVSDELASCHTSVIGGERKYVLEGHVPVEAVTQLMSERPDVRGLAVPGMPQGSLGMGFDPDARYNVYAFSGRSQDRPAVFVRMGE